MKKGSGLPGGGDPELLCGEEWDFAGQKKREGLPGSRGFVKLSLRQQREKSGDRGGQDCLGKECEF